MARKTLLTESELRRFMKLADMRPVGEKRIQEMGVPPYPGARDEEEEVEAEVELGPADDVPMGEPMDEPMEEPMDEPMDDMSVEADPAVEAKFAEFMTQVAAVAQEVLGIEVDVEEAPAAGDELGGEEDIEIDAAAVEMEPMGDLPGEAEEGGEELEFGSEEEEDPEAAMVAEVARRVAVRLQREGRKAEVVDQLAERIMKRLTK